MPYVDLIPSVMPISLTSLANGATYRSEAFNVGDKMEVGIVIKASQALSVRVAYGASSDTAATAGTGTSASLPFITSATSFASSAGSAEAGTYHSIAIPPSARKAQLVITNSSGSTANSITIDAALRRQAYPSNASNVTSGLLPLAYGGTNADLSATGGAGHVLKQASVGANITVGALTASDISGLSGVINDAGITGGTSTAYTATLASRPDPLTNGYTFVCVFHTTNGAASTIALSSGTAQPIWTNGAAAPAGAIIAGTPYVCRSDGTRVHLIGTLGVVGITTFLGPGGGVMVVTGDLGLCPVTTDSFSALSGGIPGGAGSYVQTYGNTYGYGASGCVMLGAAPGVSGAKIQCYDKNGAEQLRVDENGVFCNTIKCVTSSTLTVSSNTSAGSAIFQANTTGANGSQLVTHGFQHSTYPGAYQSFAPLITRAASTAFGVCPVATGDVAVVQFIEDNAENGCTAFVTGGAVYLTDLVPGYARNADYVNSSSPGATECGIYLSAGVLYCKPGSSWTNKIATFPQIGKA